MTATTDRQPTVFEERVYEAVTRIPIGKVTTYMDIGREIGCRSAQAIGQALKRNPYTEVPCHRVVTSNLSIGGFAGTNEGNPIRVKRDLLVAEGVAFDSESDISKSCLFTFYV